MTTNEPLPSGDENPRIADNPDAQQYEVHIGDQLVGFAQYRLAPERIIFTHTVVDPSLGGRGIGSRLVRAALDDVRARGLRVTPFCPFFRSYIRRHAEYADLVQPPGDGEKP